MCTSYQSVTESNFENIEAVGTLYPDMPIEFERQQFFWSRVRREGEHLIWEGADTTRGYGKMAIGNKSVYAMRVSYCIAKGLDLSDIEGQTIIKINCERNDCVAPEHLASRPKK